MRQKRKHEITQRRELVSDLYLRGYTQVAIGQQLSVSQATVHNDLDWIRQQWRESALRNFDDKVALELKRLDRLEREAWDAFERSQKPLQTARISGTDAGAQQRTITNRTGDARFLDIVYKCIAARRAVLGLDAPTRVAADIPPMTQEERDRHAEAIIGRLKAAAGLTYDQANELSSTEIEPGDAD